MCPTWPEITLEVPVLRTGEYWPTSSTAYDKIIMKTYLPTQFPSTVATQTLKNTEL